MVEAPNHVQRLRKAADEMRRENQNGWPLTCDAAADEIESLQRQIAELREERDEFAVTIVNLAGQLNAAEAENARLRALPLKDEVERVLEQERRTHENLLRLYEELQGHPTAYSRESRASVECTRSLLSRLRAGEQEGWRLPEGTLAVHGKDVVIAYDDFKDARRAFSILENVIGAAPSEQGGNRD